MGVWLEIRRMRVWSSGLWKKFPSSPDSCRVATRQTIRAPMEHIVYGAYRGSTQQHCTATMACQNNMVVPPAKTQISLDIHQVWSVSAVLMKRVDPYTHFLNRGAALNRFSEVVRIFRKLLGQMSLSWKTAWLLKIQMEGRVRTHTDRRPVHPAFGPGVVH